MFNVTSGMRDVVQARARQAAEEISRLTAEIENPAHTARYLISRTRANEYVGDGDPVWAPYLARLIWLCGHSGFDREYWFPALLSSDADVRQLSLAVERYVEAGQVPPANLGYALAGSAFDYAVDGYPDPRALVSFMDLMIAELVNRGVDARLAASLEWLIEQSWLAKT